MLNGGRGISGALTICAVLGLWLAGGCSSHSGFSGPTGTVSGKVTLDGKPAPAGCLLTFAGELGLIATAKVGPDGGYKLSYMGKAQVPAVKYKASVAPPTAPAMSQADYEKAMASGTTDQAAAPNPTIPEKFQNAATSGLAYEVKAGPNTIDVDLK